MIAENDVGYFVWTSNPHVERVFSAAVKNIPPKSGGCCFDVQNIPLKGVKCHFKVSNNEATAKCSKPPSVSFKTLENKPMEKPGLMRAIVKG